MLVICESRMFFSSFLAVACVIVLIFGMLELRIRYKTTVILSCSDLRITR